jgi:hypothetical protein
MGLPRSTWMCPINFGSPSSFLSGLVARFREEAEIGIALEATTRGTLMRSRRKMFFDSEIEFYARADSRRVFCEYATTPMEQNLADSRMAPSGAKRSLRLAVRPNFLTLAGPNSNFPMMGWTKVKVFNRPEGGVCTMCAREIDENLETTNLSRLK